MRTKRLGFAPAASEPTPTPSVRHETTNLSLYALCFALVILLYALSPGPIAKCFPATVATPSAKRAFTIAFFPIAFCCDHSRAVARFYKWYMKDIWHVY